MTKLLHPTAKIIIPDDIVIRWSSNPSSPLVLLNLKRRTRAFLPNEEGSLEKKTIELLQKEPISLINLCESLLEELELPRSNLPAIQGAIQKVMSILHKKGLITSVSNG
ncbi:MAG: hypothetical protein ACFFBD_22945 [Candidatus Hodarchaeota archaeon]